MTSHWDKSFKSELQLKVNSWKNLGGWLANNCSISVNIFLTQQFTCTWSRPKSSRRKLNDANHLISLDLANESDKQERSKGASSFSGSQISHYSLLCLIVILPCYSAEFVKNITSRKCIYRKASHFSDFWWWQIILFASLNSHELSLLVIFCMFWLLKWLAKKIKLRDTPFPNTSAAIASAFPLLTTKK